MLNVVQHPVIYAVHRTAIPYKPLRPERLLAPSEHVKEIIPNDKPPTCDD